MPHKRPRQRLAASASHAVPNRRTEAHLKTAIIDPGKPWQIGTSESFDGKSCDECLSEALFRPRREAQVTIDAWQRHNHAVRPHDSLGRLTPHEFKRHHRPIHDLPNRATIHECTARRTGNRSPSGCPGLCSQISCVLSLTWACPDLEYSRVRFQRRRCRCVSVCVIAGMLALLWGCGRPDDYPGTWARPDKGWFSRLGGCPDIRGEYDGANQELLAVLSGSDSIRMRERFVDHRVAVRQAKDGAWIELEFSINEAGLEQLEAGDVGGVMHDRKIRWKRNTGYHCWDGWLERNVGGPGHARIGKDRDGNLIAGSTSSVQSSIGWGNGPRINLPEGSRTLWQRAQRRDPSRNDLLLRQGHVHISRADWDHDGRVPVSIRSLAVSPVCTLLQHWYSPERSTYGFVAPSSEECPEPWGQLRVGDAGGVMMVFPGRHDKIATYLLRVRPAQAGTGEEVSLLITDARHLPIRKEAPALKLDRPDMQVP